MALVILIKNLYSEKMSRLCKYYFSHFTIKCKEWGKHFIESGCVVSVKEQSSVCDMVLCSIKYGY